MKKRLILFAVLVMMTVAATAQAEVKAGSISITPFAGGYFFENNQDLKDSVVGGLRLGYNFTENVGLEAYASYLKTEISNVPDEPSQNVYGYGMDFLYHFMPSSRFVPFVALGVGGIYLDDTSGISSDDKLTVDYGAGFKIFLTENVALRADVRHVLQLDDNYNDLLCTLGINFAFGGEKKEIVAAKVEEPPVPVIVDSDNDGVPDGLDKCPGTPSGVTVDKDGCPLDSDKDGVYDYLDKCPGTPAGVAVDKDGCPFDSDKDGVYDYLDKCPGTPAGVAVDKDGCPFDSDKDGVYDYLDKCPDTPADVVVDKDGCLQTAVIKLNVEFDFAKYVIKEQYFGEIKKLADFMEQYPWTNATIEGHTDNIGSKINNKKLSENRANSVRKCLIEKFGVAETRVTAVGYGFDKPVAGNDTEEGRQKNRRVQAFIETVKKK